VPYVDLQNSPAGKVAAVSQRQLAFNVANVLMGNSLVMPNGLTSALQRCTVYDSASDIIFSMLSFLAVLSRELQGGQQGRMLIAAAPRMVDDLWPMKLSSGVPLQQPNIYVKVPGHEKYSDSPDFMSGGTPLQALTDIAGGNVGGGGGLCRVATTQDESLMQFYPEVLAFAFYVPGDGLLPSPMTFIGTRRYLNNIEGDSSETEPYFARCGTIFKENWLNVDMMQETTGVVISGRAADVISSSFVAVQSSMVTGDICTVADMMNNVCDAQRRHLDKDISWWFSAFEASAYNPAVTGALSSIVRRVGTGPWGAGAWYGDSQQYFLAIWLATSLVNNPPVLDYYIFEMFCENPGNQCFVLGNSQGCQECVAATGKVNAEHCGTVDIWSVAQQWTGSTAQELYQALSAVGPPPTQVFDLIR
jgi:hypothetical protein